MSTKHFSLTTSKEVADAVERCSKSPAVFQGRSVQFKVVEHRPTYSSVVFEIDEDREQGDIFRDLFFIGMFTDAEMQRDDNYFPSERKNLIQKS